MSSENDLSIWVLEIVSSSISIIGSLFNLIMYSIFKDLRNEATELIVYLSISSTFLNFSYMLQLTRENNIYDKNICKIQGFCIILFHISTQIWATLISYMAYINTATENYQYRMKHRISYIIIGFFIPFLIAYSIYELELIDQSQTDRWCYIQRNKGMAKIFDIFVDILLWLLMILSYYYIMQLLIFLRKHFNNNIRNRELITTYTSKLMYIPHIQFLILVLGSIGKGVHVYSNSPSIIYNFLEYPIIFFTQLQGFFYAIIFRSNPLVIEKLDIFCQNYCCMKKKESFLEESNRRDDSNTLSESNL